LQQQFAHSQDKLVKKKAKTATLKGKIGELESNLGQVEEERKELSENIGHLKQALSGHDKDELQRVLQEKEQYASEIAHLHHSLSESSAKSTAFEEKLESLTEELATLRETEKAKSDKLLALKQENVKLEGDLENLMGLNSADDIQVLRHEVEAKNLKIAHLEAQVQDILRGSAQPSDQHQACMKCSLF